LEGVLIGASGTFALGMPRDPELGRKSGVSHGIPLFVAGRGSKRASAFLIVISTVSSLAICVVLLWKYPHICLLGVQAAATGLGYWTIMASQTRLYVGGLDGMDWVQLTEFTCRQYGLYMFANWAAANRLSGPDHQNKPDFRVRLQPLPRSGICAMTLVRSHGDLIDDRNPAATREAKDFCAPTSLKLQ
jgi:hypothetical protein